MPLGFIEIRETGVTLNISVNDGEIDFVCDLQRLRIEICAADNHDFFHVPRGFDVRTTLRMTLGKPNAEPAPVPGLQPWRVPVNLSLPEDLVQELDVVSGPRNRSAFAEDAIRRAIRREKLRIAIERTAGSLPDERYPHWRTSEDVVAWVRQMRTEETMGPSEP